MNAEPDKIISISLTVTRRDHEEGILNLTNHFRGKSVCLGPRSLALPFLSDVIVFGYQSTRGRFCLR